MMSVPSSPRLMRPLRSVMHSPRLTNRNGVLTRIAPPMTASGTVHNPIEPSAISHRLPVQERQAPVERISGENTDEDHALQHQHGCIWKAKPALQQTAARPDAAEQDRDRDYSQGIMPRQERDQDSSETVSRGEIGIGAALHGGDLDHAGETGSRAGEEAD